MEYRILREVSYEYVTYVEADSPEEAIEKANSGECEWDQEDSEAMYGECRVDENYPDEED